jgi:type IV pilus assembly protein PilC
MPTYNYSAISFNGRKIRGTIVADNELDLEARLREIDVDLIDSQQVYFKKSTRFSRVKVNDVILMCLQLEQLDRAGVPLLDALSDVRDSTESAKLRDVLTGVYEAVKNGAMLSAAFSQYPRVFGEVFTGLVAAGEKTGKLAESFAHLADHLKWSNEIVRKIKKATRYPLVLLFVISGVISVMMLYVVPKLVDFIIAQGFSIPLHTRALIAVSNAFENHFALIFGIPIGMFLVGMFMYRRFYEFAYTVDSFLLMMPLIGPVVRKIEMARFTHFFSVMFNSGIDVLDSLEASNKVVGNRVLKDAIQLVKRNVTEGNTLASSLRLSNQFPNLVVRMFKVGEDSGNMQEALENVNFFYHREVNDAVDKMVGMIQPIMTAFMGALIFWIIAAIFGPLYDSFTKMNL